MCTRNLRHGRIRGPSRPLALVVGLGGLLVQAPIASAEDQVVLAVSGLWAPERRALVQTWSDEAYAEMARTETDAGFGRGRGLEGLVGLNLNRRLGFHLVFAGLDRDGEATTSLSIPHPLYLDRPRTALGTTVLEVDETALHLDLVVRGIRGRLRGELFAGVTLFRVGADVISDVATREAYPYTELLITEIQTEREHDRTLGFNLGACLEARLARGVGITAGLRYSRGGAELTPPRGDAVFLRVGGLHLLLGVRLTL